MADVNWYQVIAGIIGGGAMGSGITAIFSSVRSRIQPVGQRIDTVPVFKGTLGSSPFRTRITVSMNKNDYYFDNLYLLNVQIVNKGNKDIESFSFGISMSDGDKAVFVESSGKDRHHQVQQLTSLGPDNPQSDLDFTLTPFNREDSYLFKLYVVQPTHKANQNPVHLTSSHPIKFVPLPTVGEVMSLVADSITLAVPMFPINILLESKRRRVHS